MFANVVKPLTAAFIWAVIIGDKGAMQANAGTTVPVVNFPASAIDIPKDKARVAEAPIIVVLISLVPSARAAAAATGSTAIAAACSCFTVRATMRSMSLMSFARSFVASSQGFKGGAIVVEVVAKVVVVDATVEVVGTRALKEKVFKLCLEKNFLELTGR